MINMIVWIAILAASILLVVWISSRANGIGFFQYLKLYWSELVILFIVSIVIIMSIVGGSK